jgi:hypothetical protein
MMPKQSKKTAKNLDEEPVLQRTSSKAVERYPPSSPLFEDGMLYDISTPAL